MAAFNASVHALGMVDVSADWAGKPALHSKVMLSKAEYESV